MDEGLMLEVQEETGLTKEEFWQSKKMIGLTASYDMGWNKRSSGNRFDSISGHAFLIGCKCRKILAAQIASKNETSVPSQVQMETPPSHMIIA